MHPFTMEWRGKSLVLVLTLVAIGLCRAEYPYNYPSDSQANPQGMFNYHNVHHQMPLSPMPAPEIVSNHNRGNLLERTSSKMRRLNERVKSEMAEYGPELINKIAPSMVKRGLKRKLSKLI